MRKLFKSLAPLLLLSSTNSQAALQDFIVVNQTGFEIYSMYLAHSGQGNWSHDFLGEYTIPHGMQTVIPFAQTEAFCFYDLRATDGRDGTLDFANINLCEISKVTLHYQNGVTWVAVE